LIRIHCLGQLAAARDGRPLGGAALQPRRMAILALLAHAGPRAMSRDRLISLLWPDVDETRARHALSQAVYALRRDLGDDEAIEGARDLRLNADLVTSDLTDFRDAIAAGAWERAAGHYDGPFLEGYHLSGAPELERWIEEQRSHLAHEFADALERAALACEERADLAGAVGWWRKLAAYDVSNARVALRLMRALAAAGDRNGAIRHVGIYRTILEQELELEPDPEVLAYAEELRAAPPAARPAEVPSAAEPQAEPIPATPGPAVFVERRRTPPPRRRAPNRWLMALPVAAAAGIFILTTAQRSGRGFDPEWVIVAPLENRTGDDALDAVGWMAAEWVTQGLARTGLVQVVDAQTMLTTARAVANDKEARPIRSIAERTGAGTVVSGSYYRDGAELRFQTQISEARTGRLLRGVDVISAPTAQPTQALEPLRQRVTGALAVLRDDRLGNWTAATSQPPSYAAYEEFLIGMAAFGNDFASAIKHFSRAAALDSTYRQALLWVGQSYANINEYARADSVLSIVESDRARLAPYDQANLDYFYLGFVRGDWNGSYQGARRMLHLAPSAAHALFALGTTANIVNRPAEAIDALERIDLARGWGNEWALRVLTVLTRAYHQLGDHNGELEWARRLRTREPEEGWTRLPEVRALAALGRTQDVLRAIDDALVFPSTPNTWDAYTPGDFLVQAGRELHAHGQPAAAQKLFERALAWFDTQPADNDATTRQHADALYLAGLLDEARATFERLFASDSTSVDYMGMLGVIAARQGRRADTDRIASLLANETRPFLFGRPSLWFARIAALRGDPAAAVAYLRRARAEGYARIYFIHLEQDFDSLREYAPFRDLLTPLGESGH
jgi:DNA-binding SARP family transcriptional activator/TolB-like protein